MVTWGSWSWCEETPIFGCFEVWLTGFGRWTPTSWKVTLKERQCCLPVDAAEVQVLQSTDEGISKWRHRCQYSNGLIRMIWGYPHFRKKPDSEHRWSSPKWKPLKFTWEHVCKRSRNIMLFQLVPAKISCRWFDRIVLRTTSGLVVGGPPATMSRWILQPVGSCVWALFLFEVTHVFSAAINTAVD